MKVSQEPLSAFSVYSEKLKQKKKPKIKVVVSSGNKLNSPNKKKSQVKSKELLQIRQMEEIGSILKTLSERSSTDKNSKGKLMAKRKNVKSATNPNLGKNQNTSFTNNTQSTEKKSKKVKEIKSSSKSSLKENLNGNDKNSTDDENEDLVSLLLKKAKCDLKGPSKITSHSSNLGSRDESLPKTSNSKNLDKAETTTHEETINNKRQLKRKNKSKPLVAKSPVCNFEVGLSPKQKTKIFEEGDIKLSKPDVKNIQADELNFANGENPIHRTSQNIKKSQKKSSVVADECKKINSTKRINNESSVENAKKVFEWLILPIKQFDFMRDYWEQQPLLIQREGDRNYYSELLSTPVIDAMLRENSIYFTKHLDVTSYTNGKRETHNLTGRAQANVVWDFYSNGCSVRLLNPQAFVPKIHALNSMLQEYFGCFVGANVYLTPPNSQGFAPHFDDIEAFVLQIEGKKHWKVYTPSINQGGFLPRESSPNFNQEDLDEPFLDVVLEPGDMLYFPRGWIHQANTVEGEHSLHITLSAYQKTSWVDLLEKTLPIALKRAAKEDIEFRKGLPRDYLGIEFHGDEKQKSHMASTALHLVQKLGHYVSLSLGAGVDLMGAQFMHDALPPVFIPEDKTRSGLGGGLKMVENGNLVNRVQVDLDTKVKLVRANVCRLVEEEEEVRLYHCLDNPLEYHADDPQFLVLPHEGMPVITHLCQSYPQFVPVRTLPHDNQEELLTLVSDLWDAGLLLAEELQQVASEDEDSDS